MPASRLRSISPALHPSPSKDRLGCLAQNLSQAGLGPHGQALSPRSVCRHRGWGGGPGDQPAGRSWGKGCSLLSPLPRVALPLLLHSAPIPSCLSGLPWPPSPTLLPSAPCFCSPSPFHPVSLFVSWSPLISPPQNPQGFLQTQSGDKLSSLVVGGVGAGLSRRAGARGTPGACRQEGTPVSRGLSPLSPLPTLAGAVVTRGEAKTQVSVGPRPGWAPGWGGHGLGCEAGAGWEETECASWLGTRPPRKPPPPGLGPGCPQGRRCIWLCGACVGTKP